MSDRRPLVLTVHPPAPPAPKRGRIGTWQFEQYVLWVDERLKEEAAIRAKRLTDAELAAEYWKANSEGWCNDALHGSTWDPYTGKPSQGDAIKARIDILERFATHPHYDERRTDA